MMLFGIIALLCIQLDAVSTEINVQAESSLCPHQCLCFRTTVRCMFLQLDHVPRVPQETTILDLRFNKIREIPRNAFTNMSQLNTLLLNNNQLTRLENDAFNGLSELRYLYLYKNHIRTIRKLAFRGLEKLEQLYLHFNKIESLEPETFFNLRSLDRLFLHNNKLSRIPPGVFRNMDSLRRLRLDSNALVCDCKMMWLARMLKDKSATTQAAATCEFPSVLQGKPLTAVSETEFHCKQPVLTEEPHDVDVSFGGTVYFSCKADGDPEPDIIWLHNNNEIKQSDDQEQQRYSVLNDGTLMIENTQVIDQGYYECMAKNMLGVAKSRKAEMKQQSDEAYNIHVPSDNDIQYQRRFTERERGKPHFVEIPQGQEVRQSETVRLRCKASGQPDPEITWTLNDSSLPVNERFRVTSSGTLIISRIQESDGGIYRCTAVNIIGSISAVAAVKIQVPPTIGTHPQSQVISEGRLVELFCRATGSPDPLITWSKDGRTLQASSRLDIDSTGTHLRIGSVRKLDEGTYVCKAQNIVGSTDTHAILTVLAKIRPSFQRVPQNTITSVGSDVLLPCIATGDPIPIILWRKDGNVLQEAENIILLSDGSLRLLNVNQTTEGIYECTADNGVGFIRTAAQITIRDVTVRPGDRFVTVSLEEARASVDRALNDTIKNIYSRDRPFTPAEILRLFRFPGPSAQQIARSAEIYERTLLIIKRHVESGAQFNLSEFSYSDVLSPAQLESIANLSGCLSHRHHVRCSEMCFHSRYRTIDGTCNNLEHSMWGASETSFYRLLQPEYENGFNTPIGWSQTGLYHGINKPSARLVSTRIVSTDVITPDDDYSHMLMQWGQFLDHDLDLAPPTISSESFVDGEDCSQSCDYNAPCFPIEIPVDDPRIISQRCMEFTRSSPICGSGSTSLLFDSVMPREQINVLTSYIDASQIYGSGKDEATHLRNLTDSQGRLRHGPFSEFGKPLLPFNEDWPIDCRRDVRESNVGCFLAGDTRVNEQLGLTTMHTIWFREHNRIAQELHSLNPQWESEKLYQETRKIVGAQMQHITYQHWLPKVFGETGMEMLGTYTGYNPNVDSAISNAFATAALRFGHTLINPILQRLNASYQEIPQGHLPLSRAFFSPFRIMEEGGIDPLLRGLFTAPTKIRKADQLLNKELTEQLFRQVHAVALDLAAINIQRGRDHALPSYNKWRRFCNLTAAQTFYDLRHEISSENLRRKLQELYSHPDNIDLWVGGISEELVPGARVGPTFLCILVDQFKRLRDGDRFYYENSGIFKPEQLIQIKQSSLAKVICDNGDNIQEVNADVFLIPQKQNPPHTRCEHLPKINLRFWTHCCEECSDGRQATLQHSISKRSFEEIYSDVPKTHAIVTHLDQQQEETPIKLKHISFFEQDLVEERVEGLEQVIINLQRQLKRLHKKMKKVETDCKLSKHRECLDSDGIHRYSNETWHPSRCSTCHCKNGWVTCQVTSSISTGGNNHSSSTADDGKCCPSC